MKNIMIDLCLVLFVLLSIHYLFDDYQIDKHIFDQNIVQFDQKVSSGKKVEKKTTSVIDESDNAFSSFIKSMSTFCIELIKIIILIISDIISTLLS